MKTIRVKTEKRLSGVRVLVAMIAGSLFVAQANAAAVTYEFSASGSQDSIMTLTLDDGGTAGSVDFSLSLSDNVGRGRLSQLLLNLDPSFTADEISGLNYSRLGGTGPTDRQTRFAAGEDAYQNGGSGAYDIRLGFQGNAFQAGEELLFRLDGIDSLTVNSFQFLSVGGAARGPWAAAGQIVGAGSVLRGAWVEGQTAPVPVPASVWMLGSALGFLGWKGRQTYLVKQSV